MKETTKHLVEKITSGEFVGHSSHLSPRIAFARHNVVDFPVRKRASM
jgi:hypothetical protein